MISIGRTDKISHFLFLSGLILLAASMPLSKFGMSVSQFLLAAGWLMGGDFKNKFRRFLRSVPALMLAAIYLMHVAGLAYTNDFDYAMKDLRIKLPLLILPFMFSSIPSLSMRDYEKVLIATVAGVTVSTFISFLVYVGIIHRPVIDIRDISIYISHIRLALLCCLAVFISVWLSFEQRERFSLPVKILLLAVAGWLVYFIFLLQSLTGITVLACSLVYVFFYQLWQHRNFWIFVVTGLIIAVIFYTGWNKVAGIWMTFKQKENMMEVDQQAKTPFGNPYHFYTDRSQCENGYLVWAYVAEEEMAEAWNKRSQFSYDGNDKKGQQLRFTLIRFLTSKGLKKDGKSINELSESEIHAIENGIANVNYLTMNSFEQRIHQVLWEFYNLKSGGNPSGHSVVQRLEYWKAAIGIIGENMLIGVGTGDVPDAFASQYEKMNSSLTKEWRLRSHNQFLSIAVAFGLPGLLLFTGVMVSLFIVGIKRHDILFQLFMITVIISMVTEDTLETQAGITFVAFFTSLFLFVNPQIRNVGGNAQQVADSRG